jgi:signal transduction histidine kinase
MCAAEFLQENPLELHSEAVQDPQASFAAANLIAEHQTAIMQLWVKSVMEEIPQAARHSRAEVANHLLALLQHVVAALSAHGRGQTPDNAADSLLLEHPSQVHGRDRASMDGYSVGDLVHEHILLRRIVAGFCTEHGPLNSRSVDIVNRVIDRSTLYSVNEFVRATEEVRRKLIGSLVHDVRTPLGVAFNYIELISQPSLPPETREQAKTTVSRNLKRAVHMLEELLDFMKLRGGIGLLMRFEYLDLSTPFKNACLEACKIYSADIICFCEEAPIFGVFDEALIVRSIENLISNAVKHGYPNSPIDISIRDHGDHVTILVHNEGEPISQEALGEIFKSFACRNNSEQKKSWGLGLTLIEAVAESHGGEVIVESSAEDGTTFGMKLFKNHRKNGEEEVMRL